MVEIRQGKQSDAASLSDLILLSAPRLLPYLFGSSQQASDYLSYACKQIDGQYAAARHFVATDSDGVIACMSLWHDDMPQAFHKATIKSLAQSLNTEQLSHLVKANEILRELFTPPNKDELCIGHLAVNKRWRGQQVGSKLIAFAQKQAKKMSKTSLVLDVEDDNAEALSFYQKWDFLPVETKQFPPTNQHYIRMQKALS